MNKDKRTGKAKTYTESEVGAVLEDIRSQQKAIFEGQDFIKTKIESLEMTAARNWEKLSGVDLKLIKVEKKAEEINSRLIIVEKKLDILDKRLTTVESPK